MLPVTTGASKSPVQAIKQQMDAVKQLIDEVQKDTHCAACSKREKLAALNQQLHALEMQKANVKSKTEMATPADSSQASGGEIRGPPVPGGDSPGSARGSTGTLLDLFA